MKLENISNIVQILDNSPIREYLNKNKNSITLFEEERIALNEIVDIINTNIENLSKPLKAVVLGEVKAGKSTLINALIQKEVAYTNVVEATSSIIEINYNESENIYIYYSDDEKTKVNSLEELNKLMDDNRSNQEFFSNIKQVNITTKTERLKKITIVDTPGLNTITSENAKRTDDYIKNADVILWVLNGHNLGQRNIIDKIEDVLCYGKPIIGIVNRIDEIDGDKDEVLEYIQDEMGYLFNEIFITSGKKAWDGFIENDSQKIEESNINNLYEFIINNIENNSKEFQIESVEMSIISQLKKDLYIHNNAKNKLDTMLNKIDEDLQSFKKFNYNIKSIIRNKMNDWLKYEFFEEEKNILANCKNKDEYNIILKQYTNEEYIKKLIDTQYNKVASYIVDEWKQHSDEFLEKKVEDIYFSVQINSFEDTTSIENYSSDDIVESAKNGGITAGAVGLGLAGYAAWLGPAAAYVTIGSAVGTFIPPLLIAGVAGGAVWNFLNKDKINKYAQVEVLVNALKNMIADDILNYIVDKLNQYSDYYHEYIIGIIYDILNQCNTSKKEVEYINMQLVKYIKKIDVELM